MKKLDAQLDAQPCSAKEGQNGQVLVLVAVLLVVMLAMLGLVLDGGRVYLHRRRLQNAADAGALAGARKLCSTHVAGEPEAEALAYAAANGAETTQVTIATEEVTVVTCRDVPLIFSRLVGVWWITPCARASAKCAPISPLSGLRPIAIPFATYNYTDTYTIWDDDQDHSSLGSDNISGRGWLNLDMCYPTGDAHCGAAGASTLTYWMNFGYPGNIYVDTWVCRETGTIGSLLIHTVDVGDILPIVVYDALSPSGLYHINFFAAFQVTGVQKTGKNKYIVGHFLEVIKPGHAWPGTEGDWVTPYLTE